MESRLHRIEVTDINRASLPLRLKQEQPGTVARKQVGLTRVRDRWIPNRIEAAEPKELLQQELEVGATVLSVSRRMKLRKKRT